MHGLFLSSFPGGCMAPDLVGHTQLLVPSLHDCFGQSASLVEAEAVLTQLYSYPLEQHSPSVCHSGLACADPCLPCLPCLYHQAIRRYHIQNRDDYKSYNKIAGMITKLTNILRQLDPKDPTRIELTDQLLDK